MPKLSPAHRKFLTKIADPRRRARRFIARLEHDGHWQMFRALKDLGMLMRHPNGDPGLYIPTSQAFQEMGFEVPDMFALLWNEPIIK